MDCHYLYKYVSFDEEMRVMDIIEKYSIMFSAPFRFNDPFDCNPRYVNDRKPKASRPDLFKKIHKPELSPAENLQVRSQAINRMSAGLKDDSLRAATLEGVGIVSLSRNPWSVLMWSHYANKHTGFMIELKIRTKFELAEDAILDKWLVPFPVIYVDSRPEISYWGETQGDDVDKLFTYKSSVWSYEEEERVVKYGGGAGAFPYVPELLISVIAGCNIADINFKRLSKAVQSANMTRSQKINLYKAEIDSKSYKLNIPGFRRLRPQKASAPRPFGGAGEAQGKAV